MKEDVFQRATALDGRIRNVAAAYTRIFNAATAEPNYKVDLTGLPSTDAARVGSGRTREIGTMTESTTPRTADLSATPRTLEALLGLEDVIRPVRHQPQECFDATLRYMTDLARTLERELRAAVDRLSETQSALADAKAAWGVKNAEWQGVKEERTFFKRRLVEAEAYAGSLRDAASALRKASGELLYGVAKALDISHFACRAERDAVLTALHEIDAVLAKNPVNAEPSASTQSAGTMESALNPGPNSDLQFRAGMEAAAALCDEEVHSGQALLNEHPRAIDPQREAILGVIDTARGLGMTIRRFAADAAWRDEVMQARTEIGRLEAAFEPLTSSSKGRAEWPSVVGCAQEGHAVGNGWRPGTEEPDVPKGHARGFNVAVRRAHDGRVYVFHACYLHALPLVFDDDRPVEAEGDAEGMTLVSGWHQEMEHYDLDTAYYPLFGADAKDDELVGWQPLPKWENSQGTPQEADHG